MKIIGRNREKENHILQIKAALGLAGVDTMEYSRRSEVSETGARINLLFDRKDGVIKSHPRTKTSDSR